LKTHKGNDGFKTYFPKVNKKGVCGSELKGRGQRIIVNKKKEFVVLAQFRLYQTLVDMKENNDIRT